MRAVLGIGGYLAATIGTSLMVLGRWIPRPEQPAAGIGPLGLLQAFYPCSRCRSIQPHIVHSTAARTCSTCGNPTHPGDTP